MPLSCAQIREDIEDVGFQTTYIYIPVLVPKNRHFCFLFRGWDAVVEARATASCALAGAAPCTLGAVSVSLIGKEESDIMRVTNFGSVSQVH